ncbi:MAG: NDP-sugar synthase [Thermoleophilia bacterium]|nr:NDP-sugar synthase [Thermoleophilia bacterium]MDH4339146.1 NDP-sugar synthase [Thermoleophilia bacterium]MDH5281492.1 NDP-sugar synthase [Thermoleophilia bacterium]
MSLRAVILVGGQGTRLRPLTDTTRKDMLPLVDRPLLSYTLEHLARHGVEEAVISCGYLPDQIEEAFGGGHSGVTLEYAVEETPLGTGGAIGFAARGLDRSFFALNGDSLREADLDQLVAFHRTTGAKATILLTPVADPSRYGLVRTAADGRVETFLEKPRPEEIDTDLINAGLYVLEPEVLELIPPDRAVSIEREVFPRLAADGAVYGIALPGYWLDVGTPESYLQAHRDVLERVFATEVGDALGADFTLVDPTAEVDPGARLVPPVYVGPRAVVEPGARLGSLAVLGAGSRLAAGSVVENAVVGSGATVGRGCSVIGSIVGDDAQIGSECALHNLAVVGPGASIGAGNFIDHGLRIGAGQSIPDRALRFS